MSTRRVRCCRSTQVPSTSASRLGSQIAAVRRPTWVAVAPTTATAVRGRASSLTRSPSCEMPWPAQ